MSKDDPGDGDVLQPVDAREVGAVGGSGVHLANLDDVVVGREALEVGEKSLWDVRKIENSDADI